MPPKPTPEDYDRIHGKYKEEIEKLIDVVVDCGNDESGDWFNLCPRLLDFFNSFDTGNDKEKMIALLIIFLNGIGWIESADGFEYDEYDEDDDEDDKNNGNNGSSGVMGLFGKVKKGES